MRLIPRSAQARKIADGRLERLVPGLRAALLRADVEGHAAGFEPRPVGVLQHLDGHLRVAAELARQRPFGAGAVEQEAAEHLGAGRRARDLVDLGLAVDGIEPHAELVGPRDVALLLDGVAERDAIRRCAPAASTISISATEAVSKQEPSDASRRSSSGAGFAFTA